jgi:siroheme synthase-like protein
MTTSSSHTISYPVFLHLTKCPVLLVGGGLSALQHAIALGEAGARVTVVSPAPHPDMGNVPGVVRLHRRAFRVADLTRVATRPRLAIAADDDVVNARVIRACDKARVWVGVPDRPELGTFLMPSVVRQGDVTFAVASGGLGPLVSRFLASRFGAAFGPEVAAVTKLLATLRPTLKSLPLSARKKVLEDVLGNSSAGAIRSDEAHRLVRAVVDALKKDPDALD